MTSEPTLLPTQDALFALADKIVADHSARQQRLGTPASEFSEIMLKHDIVMAMIDVRHEAADHAARRAWDAVRASVLPLAARSPEVML